MIFTYSLQFGLRATLGAIGTQFAMFLTILFFVKPAPDGVVGGSTEENQMIYQQQAGFWWVLLIYHFSTFAVMLWRELDVSTARYELRETAMTTMVIV